MLIKDNVIKNYLKNVYFLTGTPCGGKTTISRALGEMYNIPVYDVDERFDTHQMMSDDVNQPSMNQSFRDADEFFGRTVEEYRNWLISNTREQLDYILMDLILLSQKGPVICDGHLTVEEAEVLTDSSRIVFLLKEPVNLVDEYCNRKDHQGFSDFIHSATDYEKAKETCNETLRSLNEQRYYDIKNSDYYWLERDDERSVEETVKLVAKHFNLNPLD